MSIGYKFSKKQFIFTLSCIIALQVSFIHKKKIIYEKEATIVFQQHKKTIIGKQRGNQLIIYQAKKNENLSYLLAPIKQYENLNVVIKDSIPNILEHKENIILIMKDDEYSSIEGVNEKTIILLSNSPKINLDRILKNNTPKMIIADGSNYKSYINRWEKTCSKQKTPFFSTEQNGAFIIY